MIEYDTLREWQKLAYSKWSMCGIVVGCTGSGKTSLAMYCIQERNVNTLIVVPTIALMNQWIDEISLNLGLCNDVGSIGDGRKKIRKITVAVVNSVRDRDLSYFDMIVLDEIHRFGSIENIKPLLNDFKYKLGLTATLKRSDGEHKKLIELIGPVIYEYSTENAVREGILSKFEIINMGVDLTEQERERYEKHTKTIDTYSFQWMFQVIYNQGHPRWHEAIKAVRATTWRKAVISNAKNKIKTLVEIVKKEKGKIIIFNETIKMAELERRELKKEGLDVEIYHSKKKNQEAIEKFRRGEVRILISVKSLNEGLDVRDVDVGIRVAGTNQSRDTIQRLGRSLRVTEGKQLAKYYQLYCKDTTEKWQVIKNTSIISSASEKVIWK